MSAASLVTFRKRVGFKDLAWVSWRQHRTMLLGTGLVALVVAGLLVLLAVAVASRDSARISVLMFDSLDVPASMLATAVMCYGALVAVFWAAPLLAREYEQRTHLFAWSQDVSARRWLAGKASVLVAAAVALALVVGTAGQIMVGQLDGDTARNLGINPFPMPWFELAPLVQVGYTLFGFALGLVISAVSRRSVLSMGITLAIFVVTRMVVATFLRPYYQTPERVTPALGSNGFVGRLPDDALYVEGGLLGKSGNPIEYPQGCASATPGGRRDYYDCLREHGAASYYRDYQPAERLDSFQLIEFGLFTVLALVLFVGAWRVTRRTTQL